MTGMGGEDLPTRERSLSEDQRAELGLGALVCAVVLVLLAMVAFILKEAWPSFAHNGLRWFEPGGSVDGQIQAIFTSGDFNRAPQLLIRAWPLIWSTILTTVGAVALSFVCSLFVAVFMVEFAPGWLKRVLEPVVRLLASVPSVIYGLIGVLVVVPFIGNHLISQHAKASVTPVIQLSGYSLLAAVVILTVMIAPIMIAIFAEGLRSVPRGWLEGSLALGVNSWRTFWKIAVRTARPALIAGTVLATAQGVGRSGDAEHGVGLGRLCPQSSRRPDLLRRTVAGACGDDPAQHRRAQLATDEADPVRDRCRAAVLLGDAVARRVGGETTDEALLQRRRSGRVIATPHPVGAIR